MESPNLTSTTAVTTMEAGQKRKRSPDDIGAGGPARVGVHGNVTQINYLVKARPERLRLIEGDAESFGEVLGMIDDYEGVLQRHESLAANLGAKLVGPLLLKSFEKLFDGPIKVIQTSYNLEQSPITWLDIVTFARTNPVDFNLGDTPTGFKTCRVWIKGGQIEISEDDFRLIMSGGPERMIPTQPIPEDESAELGTLNILEARLAMLIKKADAVASKARQLNYHLKGRKTAVMSRKAADQPNSMAAEASPETHTFSPQPFAAINAARPSNVATGDVSILQQQLLEQFSVGDRRQSLPQHARAKGNRGSESGNQHTFNGNPDADNRRMSHPHTSSEDGSEGQYRILMATKIEKLARGDTIYPPCDRCRRLKFDCTKHLTACSACTKKHAKCSWKDIKEGELDWMPHIPVPSDLRATGENGYGNSIDESGHRPTQAMPTGPPSYQPISDNRMSPQQMERSSSEKRPDNLSNDHATLTQIASAAAAAGVR
ncbi:hypothetical protein LSUE1_G009784 [Lachnellula suecica]|uniref:Zn(2)-C6 fungal-type domain-containing protein n=1 Tax=Lachnellula suecica TaxID=602035 RepID=A0A8T9BRD6_9HELO|nr:hypothetical protein LSUE1_G009784 [Lachnellula suecica]